MEKKFIKQWENNKHIIESWFKETEMNKIEYEGIVNKLFDCVLKPISKYADCFDVTKITVINDCEYQGTQLFIIPYKTYNPSEQEYVITFQNYGSCSGCDALERIRGYKETIPNEKQLKDLMMLTLHLVQNTKIIYKNSNIEKYMY